MTKEQMVNELNWIAHRCGIAAAALMQRACGDPDEHRENCGCYTCTAFVGMQDATTAIDQIVKSLKE